MKLALNLFAAVISVLAFSRAGASDTQQDVQTLLASSKAFLCARGFCLSQTPPIEIKDVNGYLGYIDGNYSRISISPVLNATDTQLALIHELTHVYRGQRGPGEETWLNEGLAKFMEYQYSTVWPVSYMTRLQKEAALNFADYRPGGSGYMSSFFLVLYLYNHFGEEKLLAKLMNSKKSGWDNVTSAIQELIAEGSLKISSDLINQKSILRHFAVALWMNDKFGAEYALFYVDPHYEALNMKALGPVPPSKAESQEGMEIKFDFKRIASKPLGFNNAELAATETYSILSYNPFQIKATEQADRPLVVISITPGARD